VIPAAARTVECGYCGRRFVEDRGQSACRACPLGDACHAVRCPYCGYDNPVEPTWITRLRHWLARDESRHLVS
jgi:uncharacterized Zn-finger protein